MPNLKTYKRLPVTAAEDTKVEKKFATGRFFKLAYFAFLFFLLRSCFATTQPPNVVVEPPKKTYQTLDETLYIKKIPDYSRLNLRFEKGLISRVEDVYKNGERLGILETAWRLKSGEKLVGYINNAGLFNPSGRKIANVSKNELYDLDGRKLGEFVRGRTSLENILDKERKELAKFGKLTYVIMSKDELGKDWRITGVIDDYLKKFEKDTPDFGR